MSENETNTASTRARTPARDETVGFSPFRVLERFADEVTRILDDFGLGRERGRVPIFADIMTWAPRVDITRHEHELLVRLDLPGMDNNDVKINVTENAITVHGERERAREERRDSVHRSERNDGAFYRCVPLPAGAVTEQAKASLQNGVLEIRMPAAPGAEGRAIEIAG